MNIFGLVWHNEYFRFGVGILCSIIASGLFELFVTKYLKGITERTKNKLDNEILFIVARPLYIVIFIIGLYISIQVLTIKESWWTWIDRLFFISLIVISAKMVARLLVVLVSYWLKVEKRYERTPRLVARIITNIIYLVGFIMILNYFKINITPIIATLGIGGLAAGLALQSTLSNFFSGLHIITDRSFTVGDLIEVSQLNVTGHIEDIGWRTTRVRTLNNTVAIVPNSKLADSVVINTELPERETQVSVKCGIDYQTDLQKVEQIAEEVGRDVQNTVDGAVKNYLPSLRFTEFGESNIIFSVALKVSTYEYRPLIVHEYIKRLKARFNAEGIEISFPVRRVINK